jgi:hypothetical protein
VKIFYLTQSDLYTVPLHLIDIEERIIEELDSPAVSALGVR